MNLNTNKEKFEYNSCNGDRTLPGLYEFIMFQHLVSQDNRDIVFAK